MSEYFSVQCLAASFINDPYDWRGPKKPVPLACEADSDGALTMQVLTLISNLPSTLLDLRFFDARHNVLVMPNCGAAATWYAARSQDPAENLAHVQIVPSILKYAGGGAHVQFVFSQGPLTLARLTRSSHGYRMIISKGESVVLPIDQVQGTGANWPHAFVRTHVSIDTLVQKMEANHFHAVAGEWSNELTKFCQMLSIEYEVI
jgi:L-fucose isomerase